MAKTQTSDCSDLLRARLEIVLVWFLGIVQQSTEHRSNDIVLVIAICLIVHFLN